MAKSTAKECSECGEKFVVTSQSTESVSYCPYCGDTALSGREEDPDEDLDDDDDLRSFVPDEDQ
jgi:DNA-directed RNA polymerase subunit RPC12/RpoP